MEFRVKMGNGDIILFGQCFIQTVRYAQLLAPLWTFATQRLPRPHSPWDEINPEYLDSSLSGWEVKTCYRDAEGWDKRAKRREWNVRRGRDRL